MNTFDYHRTSALVANMRFEADPMDVFPVLIGDEVAHFHDVRGGIDNASDKHVVNLIHRVQGPGSPDRVGFGDTIEVHLSDRYYHLDVKGTRTVDNYPDDDYVLSILVKQHFFGPETFNDKLTMDIDKRKTRYE